MNFWKSFLRAWRFHPTMQIATLSVLVGVFTVVTIFFSVHKNLKKILVQWGDSVQMTVYVKDQASVESVDQLKKFLEGMQELDKIEYVTKESAAQKFMERMGRFVPSLFKDPSFENLLPASFEMKLKSTIDSAATYDKLVEVAKLISQEAAVEEVSYGQGWIENYASVLKIFTQTSLLLILVLLAGSLFVVGNSIRNSIAQRREEIEVLELIGATPAMIKMPYIIEGTLMGFGAAVISLFVCYGLYLWQSVIFSDGFSYLGLGSTLSYLGAVEIFMVTVLGACFGALGSYLCVRKMCTGWSAARANDTWQEA